MRKSINIADINGSFDRGMTKYIPLDRSNPEERSEEHTSELQSQSNLVCRLLLEKKNKIDRCSDYFSKSLSCLKSTSDGLSYYYFFCTAGRDEHRADTRSYNVFWDSQVCSISVC